MCPVVHAVDPLSVRPSVAETQPNHHTQTEARVRWGMIVTDWLLSQVFLRESELKERDGLLKRAACADMPFS